jgi:hypothetical protein
VHDVVRTAFFFLEKSSSHQHSVALHTHERASSPFLNTMSIACTLVANVYDVARDTPFFFVKKSSSHQHSVALHTHERASSRNLSSRSQSLDHNPNERPERKARSLVAITNTSTTNPEQSSFHLSPSPTQAKTL